MKNFKHFLLLLGALASCAAPAMAQTKTSALPGCTTFTGTEYTNYVQGGANCKGTVNQNQTYIAPLTTKGDIAGFSTAPVRVPVGIDGADEIGNSTAAAGISYAYKPFRGRIWSGRYLVPASFATVSTSSLSSGVIYFTQIEISDNQIFTGIGFAPVVCTACSYKVALYAAAVKTGVGTSFLVPTGTPISGTTQTVGPFTTAVATNEDAAWSSALAPGPGTYFAAIMSDTTGTANSLSSAGQSSMVGSTDMTSTSGTTRQMFTQAYASGMPDMTSNTTTKNSGSVPFYLGLKAQ